MITITVAENKPKASPKGSLAAYRARRTMAEKAGNKDAAADYSSAIRKLEDEHPELKQTAKPKAPARKKAETTEGDPRRRLACWRAWRTMSANAGDTAKVAEYDQRIKDFVVANPGVDAVKPKVRSETKDEDGEIDRAAVLVVHATHKDKLNAEIDRILRRSKERRATNAMKKAA